MRSRHLLHAEQPFLQRRSSGPWAARRGRTSAPPRHGARSGAPARGRHRGKARRSAPPWRRPARWPACARPPATRRAPPTAPRAGRARSAMAASTGWETRWASRGPSWPSCSWGKRSASHSAISRPSTRSPTNSSRSFDPAPLPRAVRPRDSRRPTTAERWVSASRSSSGRANSWPRMASARGGSPPLATDRRRRRRRSV